MFTYCDAAALLGVECVGNRWRALIDGDKGKDLWFHLLFLLGAWLLTPDEIIPGFTGGPKSFYLKCSFVGSILDKIREIDFEEEEHHRLLEMFAHAYLDITIQDAQTGRDLCAFLVPATNERQMEDLFDGGLPFSFLNPAEHTLVPGQRPAWKAQVNLINLKGEVQRICIAGGRSYKFKWEEEDNMSTVCLARPKGHMGYIKACDWLDVGCPPDFSVELELRFLLVHRQGQTVKMMARLHVFTDEGQNDYGAMSLREILRVLGWWAEGKIKLRICAFT
jgi:hypothetical protein